MTARISRTGALASVAALMLTLPVGMAGPASADPSLALLNDTSYVDSLGITHVVAEIQNTGSDSSANHVDLFLYDASGGVIGSAGDDTLLTTLGTGDRSPIDIQLPEPLPAGYDHYGVQGVAGTPGNPPNHNFTTSITSVFKDPATASRQILGTVRNDNTTAADAISLVFTFYDANKKVVGAELTPPEVSGPLAPGATTKFTESVNPDIPAYTSYGWQAQSSSPVAKNPDAAPPPAATPPPAEMTLNCNPTLAPSASTVTYGRTVTVRVTGTPGEIVTLEGFSRPATSYLPLRPDVALLPDGSQTFSVRPATNGGLRLQVRGCSTPGTAKAVTVVPVLSLAAARVGLHRYTFAGRILPGAQNRGRSMTLYARPAGGAAAAKAVARAASDGSFRATVSFPVTRTLSFWWATGATSTTAAGASPSRLLTTS